MIERLARRWMVFPIVLAPVLHIGDAGAATIAEVISPTSIVLAQGDTRTARYPYDWRRFAAL
ncbi:hypothetical protein P3T18_000998 [Paraburkholderia sp. GAS199]